MQDNDKNSGEYKIYTVDNTTFLDLYLRDTTRTYELTVNKKRHTLLSGSRYSVLPIK